MTNVQNYELMVIFSPDRSKKDQEKAIDEIKKQIKSLHGSVKYEDIWGSRTLSYKIAKHDEGFYVVLNYEIPLSGVKTLEENLRLDRNVLRFLNTKPPREFEKLNYKKMVEEDENILMNKGKVVEEEKPYAKKQAEATSPSKPNDEKKEEKKEEVKEEAKEEKKEEVKEEAKEEVKEEAKEEVKEEKKKDDSVDKDFDKKLQDIIDGEI